MPTHRTGGMTAIGILNIVFGSLGSLVMVFVVLLGGLFAAGGAQLASDGTAEGQGAGAVAAAGGGLFMVIGLVGLACWAMLLLSGIGILKLAPWGRKLAMTCGIGGLALQAVSMFMSGFDIGIVSIGTMAYCGLLVYLCTTPQWKAAFSGTPFENVALPSTTTATPAAGFDQYRDAA